MNFLIDTNIVIPLEPTSMPDLEINTEIALRFHSSSVKSGNSIFIHPAITHDIKRDKNQTRKQLRMELINRYPVLQSTPFVTILDKTIIKEAEEGSNEWVDNNLLAALKGDLVDYLVTEDIGIHKKAKQLGLESRVLLLTDAVYLIQDLFDKSPVPPPTVSNPFVYELDERDPIFDSLRYDYEGLKFDDWLKKCKREQRKAFVVRAINGRIAGVVILKREDSLPNGIKGKVLKICTFKVSELHGGNKLGELLLKPVFDYVKENNYEYTYFTAFPKQEHLIAFVKEFGFYEIINHTSAKEIALCKSFKYGPEEKSNLTPLEFNIRFGPFVTSFERNKAFVVPIKPEFYNVLFPEFGPIQVDLSGALRPCGNSIRKAYICHAGVKSINTGDNLLFYRSKDFSALSCLGIVEQTLRSKEVTEVARLVGKRTVYPYNEIKKMCNNKEVLAILFRFVGPICPRIRLRELKEKGILKAQPRSITEVQKTGIQWVRQQVGM